MKIRALAQLSAAAVLAGAMGISALLLDAAHRVEGVAMRREAFYQIVQGGAELQLLAQESLLHAEERPAIQWYWKYRTLDALLVHIRFDDPRAAELVADVRADLERANDAFEASLGLRAALVRSPGSALMQARQDMALAQLSMRLQAMSSKMARLRQLSVEADAKGRRDAVNLLLAMVGMLAAIGAGTGAVIMQRMANPIAALREGTAIIGSGNLGYRVGTEADDEIGELSREIDRMAERLMAVTASRDDLERATMERARAEAQMRYLAHHDALTALPNRVLLADRIDQALMHAKRSGRKVALLLLDLDRFKNVNDTCGHLVGDMVLQCLAARLQQVIRVADTLSRFGGDEFVILLPEIEDAATAVDIGDKLLAAMSLPFRIERHEFNLTLSVGIALFPDHAEDRESLQKNADIAMYCAKEAGRNASVVYSKALSDRTEYLSLMEADLRRAIQARQFQLYYQPQINSETHDVVGLEALLRWHSRGRWVGPSSFVPVAEETGLIIALGEWAIGEACKQIRQWQDTGLPAVAVAVNISAPQLAQKNFAEGVFRALAAAGIEHACLKLEITESMIMQRPEHMVLLLEQLRAGGVRLVVDDFGTGYSSLSYLKRFPIETLKIDQSFVRGLPDDPDDAAITRAIISMAHSLRLKVIAEGVETAEQMAFLRKNQCHDIQGYFFSPPLSAPAVETFLRRHYMRYGWPTAMMSVH